LEKPPLENDQSRPWYQVGWWTPPCASATALRASSPSKCSDGVVSTPSAMAKGAEIRSNRSDGHGACRPC
jgi:hypothetical protein